MESKKIANLLEGVGGYELKGSKDVVVRGLAIDSRKVEDGYLFAALKGHQVDGHRYIDKAISLGARVIVCSEWPGEVTEDVTFIKVTDARTSIGVIAANYYDHPSQKICCIGVTGTNGKTSIATLLYNLFKELDYKVGLISTIEIMVNEEKWKAELTTPDVLSLHQLMADMVDADCTHVFMEVSSHAADQQRIAGLDFDCGIFTNLTHDHLDYHGSLKAYIAAKQLFFTGLSDRAKAIINIDDKHGEIMVERSKAKVLRYSSRRLTDYKVRLMSDGRSGMMIDINGYQFMTRLSGAYNAMNLTAVYAVADLFLDDEALVVFEKLSGLNGAKGRLEIVHHQPRVIVDYAHTPDALSNLLESLKGSLDGGRLLTVVGCGGDRDKTKRPKMANVAYQLSDFLILTSDNPRSEDPDAIIEDMLEGLDGKDKQKVLEIVNRKSAIKTALSLSTDKDTVVIAGKGHEEYQEINGVRHFFSDQQIVKDILSNDI